MTTMTKADAERLTIAEWRKLPLQERQTEDQAAIFAMRVYGTMPHLCNFRCSGDKYQTIKAWLQRDLAITRGMI
jgi:hypothetical protein